MNCTDFKSWLLDRESHDAPLVGTAGEHLEFCEHCRKLHSIDSHIETQVRKGLRQVEPPQELFARIQLDIQSVDKGKAMVFFPWKRLVSAFAIVALLVLLVLNPFATNLKSLDEIGLFAMENHLADNLTMAFRAGDITDMSRWFTDRLGFPVSLPKLNIQGIEHLGGRECLLGKKDAAYLFYEKDGKKVSLFIVPSEDLDFNMEAERTYSIYDQGHETKIWKEGNLVYALVE